jgi:hypothetical protein
VDASVLIAGVRGQGELLGRVLAMLDDPRRSFAASVFLKLEVLPQARFHKRAAEVAFYERFFSAVARWAELDRLASRIKASAKRRQSP